MRPERYHADDLRCLLQQRKIATMDELKETLGSAADVTVFRKLAGLGYRTSYSHRGRYYTLDELAHFDALGLWSFRQVFFSRYGTLVATLEEVVGAAEADHDVTESEAVLQVGTKDALVSLVREGRLTREKVAGLSTYPQMSPHVGPSSRPGPSTMPRRGPLGSVQACVSCQMSSKLRSYCFLASWTNNSGAFTLASSP